MKHPIPVALLCFLILLSVFSLSGCLRDTENPKIGVAFGVGAAARWPKELQHMQDYAKEKDITFVSRMNTDEKAKPFKQDCMELIDSGIDVLILRARDPFNMKDVVDYAKQKGVKVVAYSTILRNEGINLFVGFDCENIGEKMGEYLVENVPRGNYILLSGDPTDRSIAEDIHKGAMKHIGLLPGKIKVILDSSIPGWSLELTKKLVTDAVTKNGGRVDAILAPNDKIAGACSEAIAALGLTGRVTIAGTDAELDAAKRIVAGTQGCTIYIDLRVIARTAMEQAVNLAKNMKVTANAELQTATGAPILCNLITGQLVTRENVDSVLIEGKVFTKEEIY